MDYKNRPTKQTGPHLDDTRFTIEVSSVLSRGSGAADKKIRVLSPLPENFGFTVGSEFTAPFDANFVGGAMQTGFAIAGVSSKMGVATKKMYSSPEPTEISFEMQFEAYEDAFFDVYAPVVYMMALGIGRRLSLADAGQLIDETLEPVARQSGRSIPSAEEFLSNSDSRFIDATDRVFGFLSFIAGPPITKIRFGNVITFRNAYITSVAPSFSNIMDSSGMPMSATVSVTAILEEDPTLNDDNFRDFFDRGIDYA